MDLIYDILWFEDRGCAIKVKYPDYRADQTILISNNKESIICSISLVIMSRNMESKETDYNILLFLNDITKDDIINNKISKGMFIIK
jgi:hypothetical protein